MTTARLRRLRTASAERRLVGMGAPVTGLSQADLDEIDDVVRGADALTTGDRMMISKLVAEDGLSLRDAQYAVVKSRAKREKSFRRFGERMNAFCLLAVGVYLLYYFLLR